MFLWDETLFEQGIDTSELAILSDNAGQMKGKLIKAHMTKKWLVTLLYSRPHTPDDNPWIEAFNKSLKYHPAKPDKFETVQDVIDWVELHRQLHNDHPHSALGYVRPNDEHEGLGDNIRKERKEDLKVASKARLEYYYESKAVKQESGERLEIHNSFAVCWQNWKTIPSNEGNNGHDFTPELGKLLAFAAENIDMKVYRLDSKVFKGVLIQVLNDLFPGG